MLFWIERNGKKGFRRCVVKPWTLHRYLLGGWAKNFTKEILLAYSRSEKLLKTLHGQTN